MSIKVLMPQAKNEPLGNYNLLLDFYNLGRNRSIVKLSEKIGKSERSLYETSKKFNWIERIAKVENSLKTSQIDENIKRFQELKKRRLDQSIEVYSDLQKTMDEYLKTKKDLQNPAENPDNLLKQVDRQFNIMNKYLKLSEKLEKEISSELGISEELEHQTKNFMKKIQLSKH